MFDYSYSGNTNKLTQLTAPSGAKTQYSYTDPLERLTEVKNSQSNNTLISKYQYAFNSSGSHRDVRASQIKTIAANPAQTINYAYDAVDQLTGELSTETPNPLLNQSYAYDAMGNRTASSRITSTTTTNLTYTTNRLNQHTAINATWGGGANTTASTLAYDADGNLASRVTTATGAGTAANVAYVYDSLDRLTAVIRKNPSTLANLGKSEFVYDHSSRLRISKEFTWNGSAWVQDSEKRRVYLGMDVI